ncbi:aspartate/glutamate racemase family protein [Paludibaculum fermentans]|uniref:aspartate/glutamate racemase family protein n=1 Tax=Paludibaculum fermentans TaxID=1473598 RepID=UPI003EBCC036
MTRTLALIHTSPMLVPAFGTLCARILPEWKIFHMVDESLIRNTIASGRLDKPTTRRLVAQIQSAFEAGAEAVLVTCSSIGPGIPVARQLFDGPIFRIDEAMAAQAVSIGRRVGVLATLSTTLEPTIQLIRGTAAAQGHDCEVISDCCEGAFEAVLRGDTETHDQLVRASLDTLMPQADTVVLAQGSMARVLAAIPPEMLSVPVYSSPELALQQIRAAL